MPNPTVTHPPTVNLSSYATTPLLNNVTRLCNSTHEAGCNQVPNWLGGMKPPPDDSGTMMRTFYVVLGLTAIVVVYFVVRAIRTRRKNNSSKRYGLLNTPDDNVEMRRLADHENEDEDDNTLFDRTRDRR